MHVFRSYVEYIQEKFMRLWASVYGTIFLKFDLLKTSLSQLGPKSALNALIDFYLYFSGILSWDQVHEYSAWTICRTKKLHS